ncbi:NAD(P)-dependent oxidoreductase [Paracoccus sp. Z330]|uniref:NAD(P)-dependent oxidoreductase n=1 Tax=Paracoccus onchidii TaxID=3017813 RepID=A0ABT4ZDN3_9RHOB|nr:NAD(P)-dependent oxidoreductase [Paracoccus onchidii]MDB6177475.1 NAD(P)-dependent oxidoreductase [Paracoccus onchidii]
MRIALTGASGFVGASIRPLLQQAGHQVTPLGHDNGFSLGARPDLHGHHALIHCAFAHQPGCFRGGEGDDPQGFVETNQTGTRLLFDQAEKCGVSRVIFLSTRAVHDGHPAGSFLTDTLPPRPVNLYGQVKSDGERYLLSKTGIKGTAIRATGLYGPGPRNKWRELFRQFQQGARLAPRVGTELHIADLADAMLRLLAHPLPPATVNASDFALDRQDLLRLVAEHTGCRTALPDRADAVDMRIAGCAALARLGWRPGGIAKLEQTMPRLLDLAPQV